MDWGFFIILLSFIIKVIVSMNKEARRAWSPGSLYVILRGGVTRLQRTKCRCSLEVWQEEVGSPTNGYEYRAPTGDSVCLFF